MPAHKWTMLLAGVTAAMLPISAASAADRFAWAAAGLPCNKVFTKRDGRVAFVSYLGERPAGLIVSGDHIQGGQAVCKLLSRKAEGNVFVAVLGCKEEIILDKIVVHFRFNNDDELVRFDPNVPEIATTYRRCTM